MLARAIFVLAFGGFATITSLRAADPLLILIGADYVITPAAASVVITAAVFGYGALQFVIGPMGDRIGKFRLMFFSSMVASIASAGCAIAPDLDWLVAARVLAGAATGAFVPLSMAWIGDVVSYERRQAMLARYVLGNWAGLSVGVLASGFLGEHFGWHAILWVLAVIYAALAVALWNEMRVNELTRTLASAPTSIGEAYRRMGGVLRDPWARTVFGVVLFNGISIFSPLAFVALHLQQVHGLGAGAGAAMMLAFAAGGIAYAWNAGRLVARFGETGLLAIGGSVLLAGWLGFLFAPGLAASALVLGLLGGALPMVHNTLQVNGTQLAPQARGAAMTLFSTSLFIGQSIGIWAGGRAIDTFGTRVVIVFAAIAGSCVAFAFRFLLVARNRRAALPAA